MKYIYQNKYVKLLTSDKLRRSNLDFSYSENIYKNELTINDPCDSVILNQQYNQHRGLRKI